MRRAVLATYSPDKRASLLSSLELTGFQKGLHLICQAGRESPVPGAISLRERVAEPGEAVTQHLDAKRDN